MGLAFIEYRDPLVGVIALFSLILLVYAASSVFAKYKTSSRTKRLEKFIENFSLNLSGEDEIAEILKESPNAAKVLFVVGEGYMLAGEQEKAVRFFTLILKNVPTRDKELHIRTLCTLSKCFIKLGFIQRTKSSLVEALRLRSKNIEALILLLAVYTKTGEYEDALGVSESLQEISDVYVPYVKFFEGFLAFKKGLLPLGAYEQSKEPFFLREEAKSLANSGKIDELITFCQDKDAFLFCDILWQVSLGEPQKIRIKNDKKLNEIFAAKGMIEKEDEFSCFELEVAYSLSKVRPNSGVVVFGYHCSSCGHEDFDYFPVCKKCAKLSSCVVAPKATKKVMVDFDMSSFS